MPDPIAKTSMLIRSTLPEAFDAFVTPEKITRFWLDAASGPLKEGARIEWQFMVPGAKETVQVLEVSDQRRIRFKWSDDIEVTIGFARHDKRSIVVSVEASGFGSGQPIDHLVNTTEGFSIVLCDLKCFLESGRSANLVRDKAELIASSMKCSKKQA